MRQVLAIATCVCTSVAINKLTTFNSLFTSDSDSTDASLINETIVSCGFLLANSALAMVYQIFSIVIDAISNFEVKKQIVVSLQSIIVIIV